MNTSLGKRLAKTLLVTTVLLFISGIYLTGISVWEGILGENLEKANFQYVFAIHLLVSAPFILLFALYLTSHLIAIKHIRNTRARTAGIYLSLSVVLTSLTGALLIRGVFDFELNASILRNLVYAAHIIIPLLAILLYFRHRKNGRHPIQIEWFWTKLSASTLVLIALTGISVISFDEDEQTLDFLPSLLKVKTDSVIKSESFMLDKYCQGCHQDTHNQWSSSAHKFSSFNNPFYSFSVNNTRAHMLERDGDVVASRFCAGCHDPLPLISGVFDSPSFPSNNEKSAKAGITCTVCHSVISIDSTKGNADFTLQKPTHYPFAFSDSDLLQSFSNVLLKSNPDFHKETFLKPLHKTPEFCGSCHKVHIPEKVNKYRWLRGQNHYDSFLQSGVSGHNVDSFYYPKQAKNNCNSCHMSYQISDEDSGAKMQSISSELSIRDHLFASGNTAIAATLSYDRDSVIQRHKDLLEESVSLDIVGIRENGKINGEFQFLQNESNVNLAANKTYLIEVVIRTKTLGHLFTNGTADSNQLWVQLQLFDDDLEIGSSGKPLATGEIPELETHFIKNFLVDAEGERIKERNVEDIFTSAKSHQIPPGAADVVHFKFTLPSGYSEKLRIDAKLNYRKFDKDYANKSFKAAGLLEQALPTTIISQDSVSIVGDKVKIANSRAKATPPQRLNDYGIGLLRKPSKKQYRQAEEIFKLVEQYGEAQGTMNLVRLYYNEGQLEKAFKKLDYLHSTGIDNSWSAEWYSALISIDNGFINEGIQSLNKLMNIDNWPTAKERGFDFSKDYDLLIKLAETLFLYATINEGDILKYNSLIKEANMIYSRLLSLDPENASAHFGIANIARTQGDSDKANYHSTLYKKYKPDEHSESSAVTLARAKDSYIDKIVNAVVIYSLN
ncbi:MAG: multiheme c-type cytochrome [Glaciecola sp.]